MVLSELVHGGFYRHRVHECVRFVGSHPDDGACLILEVDNLDTDAVLGELVWGESQDLTEPF